MKSWSGVLSRPISEACFRFFSFSWFRFFLAFDPENKQFLTYSSVTFGDFAISIAAGAAGVLAFTDGAPATLIGVAVALWLCYWRWSAWDCLWLLAISNWPPEHLFLRLQT